MLLLSIMIRHPEQTGASPLKLAILASARVATYDLARDEGITAGAKDPPSPLHASCVS